MTEREEYNRTFTVRISDTDWESLELLSKMYMKSKSELIRGVIRTLIKNLHDYYKTMEVEDAAENAPTD